MHILQKLPQLGHFSLTFPIDVQLAFSSTLSLCQPLTQDDDLALQLMLLAFNTPAEALLRLQVLFQDANAFLQFPHGQVGGVGGGVDVGVHLTGDVA